MQSRIRKAAEDSSGRSSNRRVAPTARLKLCHPERGAQRRVEGPL